LRDEGFGFVGERVVEANFHIKAVVSYLLLVVSGLFRPKTNDDCIRGWKENKQPGREVVTSLQVIGGFPDRCAGLLGAIGT